jgi:hypothetical protein
MKLSHRQFTCTVSSRRQALYSWTSVRVAVEVPSEIVGTSLYYSSALSNILAMLSDKVDNTVRFLPRAGELHCLPESDEKLLDETAGPLNTQPAPVSDELFEAKTFSLVFDFVEECQIWLPSPELVQ